MPETQPSASAPESLRNVVIRLTGRSQDGIQSTDSFLAQLAGSTDAALKLAEGNSPGKFGVYYEKKLPTKNELEWQWVKDAQAAAADLSGKDLLRKRFASMR